MSSSVYKLYRLTVSSCTVTLVQSRRYGALGARCLIASIKCVARWQSETWSVGGESALVETPADA